MCCVDIWLLIAVPFLVWVCVCWMCTVLPAGKIWTPGCVYAGCVLFCPLVQYGRLGVCMLDVYCSARWYNMDAWVCVCWMCTVLPACTIWTPGCVYAGCVLFCAQVQYGTLVCRHTIHILHTYSNISITKIEVSFCITSYDVFELIWIIHISNLQ
jgi:hypothetical protein